MPYSVFIQLDTIFPWKLTPFSVGLFTEEGGTMEKHSHNLDAHPQLHSLCSLTWDKVIHVSTEGERHWSLVSLMKLGWFECRKRNSHPHPQIV